MLVPILIGATLYGKNMLPMGSILIPLIVAPFKLWLFHKKTGSPVQNWFIDTDTNLLKMYVHLLLIA